MSEHGNEHEGVVTAALLDKGYGFIRSKIDDDIFFHRSDLAGELEFNEQLLERRVKFRVVDHGKGPRAVGIQSAD